MYSSLEFPHQLYLVEQRLQPVVLDFHQAATRKAVVIVSAEGNRKLVRLPWNNAFCLLSIHGAQICYLCGFELRQCRLAPKGPKWEG